MPAIYWIALGVLGMGGELLLPGVFLVWVGLALLGTGILTASADLAFGAEQMVLTWQAMSFIALLALAITVALKMRRPLKPGHLNTPASGLVGRQGKLITMSPDGQAGRVTVGDSDWPARMVEGQVVANGGTVIVDGVDGMTLVLRSA